MVEGAKPLLVIRFNQRKVFYERPLYNAVSKAVAIKPNVVLDVVSFVPQTPSEDSQEKMNQMAASQQSAVIGTLRSIGIPANQIRASRDIAASYGMKYAHLRYFNAAGACPEEEIGERRVNHVRSEEAVNTGADSVVANCPFCIQMFEDGIPAVQPQEEGRMRAFDIAELLEQAVLGPKDGTSR